MLQYVCPATGASSGSLLVSEAVEDTACVLAAALPHLLLPAGAPSRLLPLPGAL